MNFITNLFSSKKQEMYNLNPSINIWKEGDSGNVITIRLIDKRKVKIVISSPNVTAKELLEWLCLKLKITPHNWFLWTRIDALEHYVFEGDEYINRYEEIGLNPAVVIR